MLVLKEADKRIKSPRYQAINVLNDFMQGAASRLPTSSSELEEVKRQLAMAEEEAQQLRASAKAAQGNYMMLLILVHPKS